MSSPASTSASTSAAAADKPTAAAPPKATAAPAKPAPTAAAPLPLQWLWSRASFWTGLCAVLVYWDHQALRGGWVYDDAGSVVRNIVVNGQLPWTEVFRRDFWGAEMDTARSHKSFRPITTITFILNHMLAMHIKDPEETYPPTHTFHLVNVFLHGIVTAMITEAAHYVFEIVYHHKRKRNPTSFHQNLFVMQLIVGAIFGLHPVHAEVVSNITSRGELLMSCFMLTAFLSYASAIRAAAQSSAMAPSPATSQTTATAKAKAQSDEAASAKKMDAAQEETVAASPATDSATQSSAQSKENSTSTAESSRDAELNAELNAKLNTKHDSVDMKHITKVYIVPWLGMTCSLFSKEQGATTLISLVLWDFLYHHGTVVTLWKQLTAPANPSEGKRARDFALRTIILAIQTLLVCYWRYLLNGETSPDFIEAQNPAGFAPDQFTRSFSIPWVYCLYVRDALYPMYLGPDWSGLSIDLIKSASDPRIIFVIVLWYLAGQSFWSMVVGLPSLPAASATTTADAKPSAATATSGPTTAAAADANTPDAKTESSPRTTQSLHIDDARLRVANMAVWAFAFSPFLLSSNILVVVGLMKADRVIYLPLFGFCILEALLLDMLCVRGVSIMTPGFTSRKQTLFWIGHWGFIVQMFWFCVRTHARNLAWSRALDLWEHAYLVNPRSHHTRYNYGYELSIKQRYIEAEEVLRPIGSAHVDGPSNTFLYAMVLFNLDRCDEANVLLDEAFAVIDQKRKEGGVRNSDSSLARTESNLLVARAHCVGDDLKLRGGILYEAVQADQTNDYAVNLATEMMEKLQKMEELKKQYGLS